MARRDQVTCPSQDFDVAVTIAEISHNLNMSQWLKGPFLGLSVADTALSPVCTSPCWPLQPQLQERGGKPPGIPSQIFTFCK